MLLEPDLRRCDQDGVPAYLEATSPLNRAFYARNGFEVIEQCTYARAQSRHGGCRASQAFPRVSLAVFPSGSPLPSTTSAPSRPGLFGGFAGTTGLSDFRCSFIEGVPPQRSPRGPPPADLPPREPSRTGHRQRTRASIGSPGSRAWRFACMHRVYDRAGSVGHSR